MKLLRFRIKIIQGDLTRQRVEAIVNAANTTLLGGGGVDGAIHRAAGPELLKECRRLKGCLPGEAKLTRGYLLPAKWVIHTVGPVWSGGRNKEDKILANCYLNSLKCALKHKIKSIAFPAISTGVYRFPLERACRIALSETGEFLKENPALEEVYFVCFAEKDYRSYRKIFAEIF